MIDRDSGVRFVGLVYRAHNPQWSWAPLSGEGAKRHGGRFNRRGVPALYTSLLPLTAIREASPLGRPIQPLTLCAYRVDAAPVFDACDADQRATAGVAETDLRCPDWQRQMLAGAEPASQVLADRLIAAGYVAMKVQSFARGAGPDETNMVFWRWSDAPPSRVVVIDDEGRLRREKPESVFD